MTSRLESQIERFAPGFRDLVIGRHAMAPAAMEAHDANLIGGEIGGGENSLAQLFFRPVARRVPYATPLRGVYICSASTPPGGAIHGMAGYHAARAALRAVRLLPSDDKLAAGVRVARGK
jgi:phytoene dehydrogenase-like protein